MRPLPVATALTKPFWEATRERVLLIQECTECRHSIHYPRDVCPYCHGDQLEWRESPGRGAIYAFTVENRPQATGFGQDPYVIALVDLLEGVRLTANIVGSPVADVRVGRAVELDWLVLGDGRNLPVFRLAERHAQTSEGSGLS